MCLKLTYYLQYLLLSIYGKNEDYCVSKYPRWCCEKCKTSIFLFYPTVTNLNRHIAFRHPGISTANHIFRLVVLLARYKTSPEKLHDGTLKSVFNDPDVMNQWYFVRSEYSCVHLSHELNKLWDLGINGTGVNVALVDDGIEKNHVDLIRNYNSDHSFNFLRNSYHIQTSSETQSTGLAGLISAVGNNHKCGVGAAPYSIISNLQVYDDESKLVSDISFAWAIRHSQDIIPLYLLNLKIPHEYRLKSYPGSNFKLVVDMGVKEGRGGAGNIYLTGSGDENLKGSNCAFNGFIQSKEILVIGSITHMGLASVFSERCNALLASALSSSHLSEGQSLYSTSLNNRCDNSVEGSISSAAISCGIIALLLSHSPLLTVRQIVNLIIRTSMQFNEEYVTNAAGYSYSNALGFGMINASGLIEHSNNYEILNLSEENICFSNSLEGSLRVPKSKITPFYIYSSGCLNAHNCVTEVEYVFFTFTAILKRRNSLSINLTSPGGTEFAILQPRTYDFSEVGFYNWRLKLMGYYGENPLGVWKIKVYSAGTNTRIKKIRIDFHGTCNYPIINVIMHETIREYVCSKDLLYQPSLYTHICLQDFSASYTEPVVDKLSFTCKEFPQIEHLNTLI